MEKDDNVPVTSKTSRIRAASGLLLRKYMAVCFAADRKFNFFSGSFYFLVSSQRKVCSTFWLHCFDVSTVVSSFNRFLLLALM